MKYIFKILVLLLMLNVQVLFAENNSDDAFKAYEKGEKLYQEKKYDEALKWLLKSYELEKDASVANNIGITYEDIENNVKAVEWYKLAYTLGSNGGAYNLALLYEEKLDDIPNAISMYKKSDEMGHKIAAYNLALLYKNTQKDYDKSIEWYKVSIRKGNISAIKNLGNLYRTEKKDNLLGSAYMIGLIDKKYSKEKVFDYLRNKLKIDEVTLKKAYELQKTLVPNPYTGGVD